MFWTLKSKALLNERVSLAYNSTESDKHGSKEVKTTETLFMRMWKLILGNKDFKKWNIDIEKLETDHAFCFCPTCRCWKSPRWMFWTVCSQRCEDSLPPVQLRVNARYRKSSWIAKTQRGRTKRTTHTSEEHFSAPPVWGAGKGNMRNVTFYPSSLRQQFAYSQESSRHTDTWNNN